MWKVMITNHVFWNSQTKWVWTIIWLHFGTWSWFNLGSILGSDYKIDFDPQRGGKVWTLDFRDITSKTSGGNREITRHAKTFFFLSWSHCSHLGFAMWRPKRSKSNGCKNQGDRHASCVASAAKCLSKKQHHKNFPDSKTSISIYLSIYNIYIYIYIYVCVCVCPTYLL